MNTNEQLTSQQIVDQMSEVLKDLNKAHNMMKGARIFRDAVLARHRSMTNDLFDIFEDVIAPMEEAFQAASKKHTELFDMMMGVK
jgi:hypothetical protein